MNNKLPYTLRGMKAKDGSFYCNIVAGNGAVISTRETQKTKAAVNRAMKKLASGQELTIHRYTTKVKGKDQYGFSLISPSNGKVVWASELYTYRQARNRIARKLVTSNFVIAKW